MAHFSVWYSPIRYWQDMPALPDVRFFGVADLWDIPETL